jgi:hypothetical protein
MGVTGIPVAGDAPSPRFGPGTALTARSMLPALTLCSFANCRVVGRSICCSFDRTEDSTSRSCNETLNGTTSVGTIKPASGVAGTSSACYPSHLAATKFL